MIEGINYFNFSKRKEKAMLVLITICIIFVNSNVSETPKNINSNY